MNLISQEDVNAASYKKAAVIMFNNRSALPEMVVYEETVIPDIMSQQTGQYIVPYHPDIKIPLPDEALALLSNVQTTKTLGIDGLMGILYAVYGFSRTYQPEVQPDGND